MRHDGPKRARSWKRRIQAKESLKRIGSPLLGGDAYRLFAQIRKENGRLDIVFANAGVTRRQPRAVGGARD
jgi:hypothetical protein